MLTFPSRCGDLSVAVSGGDGMSFQDHGANTLERVNVFKRVPISSDDVAFLPDGEGA